MLKFLIPKKLVLQSSDSKVVIPPQITKKPRTSKTKLASSPLIPKPITAVPVSQISKQWATFATQVVGKATEKPVATKSKVTVFSAPSTVIN